MKNTSLNSNNKKIMNVKKINLEAISDKTNNKEPISKNNINLKSNLQNKEESKDNSEDESSEESDIDIDYGRLTF